MLRLVIDVRYINDFGIGTYIRNLIQALGRADHENHYLLIARSADIEDLAGLPPNFQTIVYPYPDSDWMNQIRFPLFLGDLHADVIHLPLNVVPLFMVKPYVVTIHDMSSLLFGTESGMKENLRLYRFRRGLLRADLVIAVSDATRRDVENLLRIPAARIRQVYGAPDPKFLTEPSELTGGGSAWADEKKRLLERYQINYPFLLYAGRIRPHKNIPRLVEAFAVVRGELENHPVYRDLRLIIIGDEISSHPEVRRTVIQTRMEHAVRFLGFVPFDTLKMFYSAAAAFIFPSLYEGFGLPPLEAMASGTPVVTTSVSSLPEVVGDSAVIVNPENVFDMARGIKEALVDEELREHLIRSGYGQLRKFNWSRTAEEVLQVYREVAGKR